METPVQITFHGDKRNPEPSTAVIQFPGGHVEVSRSSDGSYWAHVEVVDPSNTLASRIDYSHEARDLGIPPIPGQQFIKHMAVQITNNVPHFDPNA